MTSCWPNRRTCNKNSAPSSMQHATQMLSCLFIRWRFAVMKSTCPQDMAPTNHLVLTQFLNLNIPLFIFCIFHKYRKIKNLTSKILHTTKPWFSSLKMVNLWTAHNFRDCYYSCLVQCCTLKRNFLAGPAMTAA